MNSIKYKKLIQGIILCALVGLASVGEMAFAQSNGKAAHPGKFITVEKTYKNSNVDGYNVYLPHSCTRDSRAFPLIVFLQGGLGVGGEVDVIFNWALAKALKDTPKLKTELDSLRANTFVYVMPHLSRGEFYTNEEAIQAIIHEVSETYNIDNRRIYLTGLSRGGHGSWGLASRLPGTFAALAPMAGASHGIKSYENLLDLPILTAHNEFDHIVNSRDTRETVRKIEALSRKKFQKVKDTKDMDYRGADLIFISDKGKKAGHNSWAPVYNDVNFFKWLLRFERN